MVEIPSFEGENWTPNSNTNLLYMSSIVFNKKCDRDFAHYVNVRP